MRLKTHVDEGFGRALCHQPDVPAERLVADQYDLATCEKCQHERRYGSQRWMGDEPAPAWHIPLPRRQR